MNIEKDLHAIEDLALLNQDENWRFRVFLKGYDIPPRKLNAMVMNLTREISEKIDCTACGNCCKKLEPSLIPMDVSRLAKKLNMPEKQFYDTYLTSDFESDIIFKERPCPFFNDNRCMVYAARPEVCRSYPHLYNEDFISRLIKIVQNTSICPIVFNVYEGLKDRLREPFKIFEDEFLEEL